MGKYVFLRGVENAGLKPVPLLFFTRVVIRNKFCIR